MAKPMRILSVDGGGIRGVIPASVLAEVERMIRQRLGPEARLADHFDLVAGTSTGGILAGLLVLPSEVDRSDRPAAGWRSIRSAEDVLGFYFEHGPTLFQRTVGERVRRVGGLVDERYGSTGFNLVLDEVLGPRRGGEPELMLSDLTTPTVITTFNATTGEPHFFKQHRAAQPGGPDVSLRDVARATAAAPTYFEAARVVAGGREIGACVDGGVFANNPALCAYAEAHSAFGYAARDMAILSIGTGSSLETHTHDQMRDWGVTQWLKPLLDMMMAGSSRVVDHQLRQLFGTLAPGAADAQYLRLQVDLSAEPPSVVKMDNADPENLRRLAEIGRDLVAAHRARIERFVDRQLLGVDEPEPVDGSTGQKR